VKFAAPDGTFFSAWVPHGAQPGQTFRIYLEGSVALQACSVLCPPDKQSGEEVTFKAPDNKVYQAVVPQGISGGESFIAWLRTQPVAPPPPVEPLDPEDMKPWIEAARNFELNLDFQIGDEVEEEDKAATELLSDDTLSTQELPKLMARMKVASEGKSTIMALSDKLILARIVDNMGLPQMPVLLDIASEDTLEEDIRKFVDERSQCDEPCALFVKPSHLSSSEGAICLPPPTVETQVFKPTSAEEKERAAQDLMDHVRRFMGARANEVESLALQAVRPGFLVQPRYESVVGFRAPLELRVLVLWGKARTGIWWWGLDGSPEAHRNAWIQRCPAKRGELSEHDTWDVLHEHPGENPGYIAALELFQRHMPSMSAAAERLASAVGAPFLRCDFFVGSSRWGVRLNEVAYGSSIEHRRRPKDGGKRLVDDGPAIAHILREGMAACRQHWPWEDFLKRLGATGDSYKEMEVEESSTPRLDLPRRARLPSRDPECDRWAVPPELCVTPRADPGKAQQVPFSDAAAQGACVKSAGNKEDSAAQAMKLNGAPGKSDAVKATFRNMSSIPVELHWLGLGDRNVSQGSLAPGAAVLVKTFHLHRFTLSDEAGAVVHHWQADRLKGDNQEVRLEDAALRRKPNVFVLGVRQPSVPRGSWPPLRTTCPWKWNSSGGIHKVGSSFLRAG